MGGGGITRVKNHLAHVDPTRSVKFCEKVPPEVREEMQALLQGNVVKKKNKKSLDATLQKTLTKNVGGEESSEEAYEAQLRAVMKRSRQEAAQTEWEARMMSGPGSGSTAKSPPAAPSLYKSASAKQTKIDEIVDPKKRTWLGRHITKFFVHQHVPASKAASHEFKNMIASAQDLGNPQFVISNFIFILSNRMCS